MSDHARLSDRIYAGSARVHVEVRLWDPVSGEALRMRGYLDQLTLDGEPRPLRGFTLSGRTADWRMKRDGKPAGILR